MSLRVVRQTAPRDRGEWFSGGDDQINSTLDRETFLNDKDVDAFIKRTRDLLNEDLPERICTSRETETPTGAKSKSAAPHPGAGGAAAPVPLYPPFHKYHHHRPAYFWWCANLIDAAAGYRFPITKGISDPTASRWRGYDSLRANAGVLLVLQHQLRAAYKKKNHYAAADVAKDIQIWGGTQNGNVGAINHLNTPPRQFCDYLRWCEKCFGHGASVSVARPSVGPAYQLRSNAGFSKIYSLLFDNFVIYDSRVAAGLGKLIVRDARAQKLPALPANLRDLVWMKGRGGTLRNPSLSPHTFSTCAHNDNMEHLRSNVKANWILAALLRGTRFSKIVAAHSYFMPVTPLRALEAALFMIGYDLRGNPPYP